MEIGPLYVVGGRQPHGADVDWEERNRGVILRVEPLSGDIRCVAEYVSAPGTYALSSSQVTFKSAWMGEGLLYCTTMTEIVVFEIPDFREPVQHISLPCFNDLHCVRPAGNGKNLMVASSGLDCCIEVTPDGGVVSITPTLNESLWERFDPHVDYRLVSTKPHRSHPNHLFYVGGELWATRFEQRDAVSVEDHSRRIDVAVERPHDGVIYGDSIYFTTVDGKIVIADLGTLEVRRVLDLAQFHRTRSEILGWARGIWHVAPDLVWIGFTRMRRLTMEMRVTAGMLRPTHIALYDLVKQRAIIEINLEPAGLDTVYSIVPVWA